MRLIGVKSAPLAQRRKKKMAASALRVATERPLLVLMPLPLTPLPLTPMLIEMDFTDEECGLRARTNLNLS